MIFHDFHAFSQGWFGAAILQAFGPRASFRARRARIHQLRLEV
jgi:hypothetical protein